MAEPVTVKNGQSEITLFAETNFRNQRRRFGIKPDDRRRHMYVIGKTGTGKTTMLANMVVADILSGKGVGVVDPHGEFAEEMLDFVPSSRVNDVVYFNPADLNHPVAFNVLEKVVPEHRHLVASGVVGVFKKLWADTWGPRLEYVLRNAILALLEYPGSTLLGIMRMLIDKEYRKKVVDKISDPIVRSFWTDEYSKYPDRFQAEAINPIQNKVGQFLTSPIIRNIVGQTKSAINMREVMDTQKILIMNLSKGRIGEDNSQLLGALMITKLQLAAMSRVDMPEADRRDFFLYVDEFQNFATQSFTNILSEARKYRLALILAHQYIEQLPEEVAAAVFGNVGTLISFRVGATDAEYLEKEFEPDFMQNDLVNLKNFHIYLKLMIDGVASRAFSATTLARYPRPEVSHQEKIIRISRERYATAREEVEAKIAKWSGMLGGDDEGFAGERPVSVMPQPRSKERWRGPGSRSEQRPTPEANGRRHPEPRASEPVIHIPNKPPASLSETLKRTPPAAPRERKGPDLVGLRELLGEAMTASGGERQKTKPVQTESKPADSAPTHERREPPRERLQPQGLKPGERVKFE
ncbi:type IV secretion system DNA-binding domain-containing protein [Candidatus Parcubacteria bacterium]|nr:type IV secretion system DNA-binding domain-containing protein [Candidatus Parcubacteria bacterium]